MPVNGAQWAWFFFFSGGAMGGWLVLVILGIEAWKSFRKVRT